MKHKALIRKCYGCGMVTAINIDSTPENRKRLASGIPIIIEVSREEAQKAWATAGRCKCNQESEETINKSMQDQNILLQYVRDRRNQLRGVVVAKKLNENEIGVGWSYTKVKAGDRFEKKRGKEIAIGRAVSPHSPERVPYAVKPIVERMKHRAERYFLKKR